MSLSDIAAIGSLVSGVAVLVSLVYLSLQVRQAEKNQKAALKQGRAIRMVETSLAVCEPSMADAWPRGVSGASDITATQFFQFMGNIRAILAGAEDTYFQHKEGLISDESLASVRAGWLRLLTMPGVRALWVLIRDSHEPGFAAFMDGMMHEVSAAPTYDLFSVWRAEVAKQMPGHTH
jgi:hypothetical protein